jgi:hypothetical protein
MSISFVQSAAGAGAFPPSAVPYTASVPAGHVLLCSYWNISGDPGALTCTDTLNGAWGQIGSTYFDAVNNFAVASFYIQAGSTGTPTVTVAQTNDMYGGIIISDFTGFVSAPAIDTTISPGTFNATMNTSPAAGTVTAANNNEILGASLYSSQGVSGTVPNWNQTFAGFNNWQSFYKIKNTAGANNFSATLTAPGVWDLYLWGIYDTGTPPATGGNQSLTTLGVG